MTAGGKATASNHSKHTIKHRPFCCKIIESRGFLHSRTILHLNRNFDKDIPMTRKKRHGKEGARDLTFGVHSGITKQKRLQDKLLRAPILAVGKQARVQGISLGCTRNLRHVPMRGEVMQNMALRDNQNSGARPTLRANE